MNRASATTAMLIVLEEVAAGCRIDLAPSLDTIKAILDRLEDVHPPCGEERPEGCSCDRDD